MRYNCHINVEVCCSIKSIKYIYKGTDYVSFAVQDSGRLDASQL